MQAIVRCHFDQISVLLPLKNGFYEPYGLSIPTDVALFEFPKETSQPMVSWFSWGPRSLWGTILQLNPVDRSSFSHTIHCIFESSAAEACPAVQNGLIYSLSAFLIAAPSGTESCSAPQLVSQSFRTGEGVPTRTRMSLRA